MIRTGGDNTRGYTVIVYIDDEGAIIETEKFDGNEYDRLLRCETMLARVLEDPRGLLLVDRISKEKGTHSD